MTGIGNENKRIKDRETGHLWLSGRNECCMNAILRLWNLRIKDQHTARENKSQNYINVGSTDERLEM